MNILVDGVELYQEVENLGEIAEEDPQPPV